MPDSVIEVLAGQVGGSLARLRGFGLLDPYQDLYDPARLAVAVNPLAAGRLEPLSTTEQAALAGVTVAALGAAWGGTAPQPGRALELDLQLTRLALLGDDPTVVAACAAGAVHQLRRGVAAEAFRLGHDAIELLDRHNRAVPLGLLRAAADAALTSGDGDTGEALLDRAMHQVVAGDQDGADSLDHARVTAERARRFITLGEPEQAQQLLRHAHHLFTTAGSEREAAVVMGEIADIAYQRGDYDEALRIRRDIALPVYERLGDTRSTALTWSKIADIASQRGDYDEAAQLQHKCLEVNTQLGDLDGIAAAHWDLAQIDLAQQDYQSALPRLLESFQIVRQLQRADGIATVGMTLGELMLAAGLTGPAREVLGESLTAANKIGAPDLTRQINELLNRPVETNEET